MRVGIIGVSGFLLLTACATSTPVESPSSSLAARAQPASPVALTFAWPEGSEASVEETVQKRGNTAVERYRVRWLPVADDPAHHDVVLDQLQMVVVNGTPVDATTDRKMLAEIERMSAMLPHMRIDDSGTLSDVVGVDELLKSIAETMPVDERARFLAMMRSPAGQPLLRGAAEKIWNTWVGGLVGLQAPPDEDLVAVTEVKGPDGPLQQETHFLLRIAGDHVVVDTRTETPSTVARALLMPVLKPMIEALATKDGTKDGANAASTFSAILDKIECSIVSSTSTELEPSTMRPHRAQSRQTIRVVFEGKVEERIEQHDYVFTWTSPAGR